ncbi:5'-nucleotidase C-terminal domain-containing protein, partial [Acinetobacter baumannii]|nr:5'-nucleotidase C-terminal domain-containing protein [Acinetobacter baumannii]
QQWSGANANSPRILQPSKELSYQYAANTSVSPRASNIMVAGSPLVDTKVYRVTVNSFLADGGDNFTVLKEGQNRVGGGQDIDALESYVAKNSPLIIPATTRIKVIK